MIRKYEISPGVYWKKSDFFREFKGNGRLFEHCWRRFLIARGCIETAFIMDFLTEEAAYVVNDSSSNFYIYGN